MGEVVRDQRTLGLQCRGGDEEVRIGEQGPLPVEVAIQRGGAVHYLIGKREDETGLAQEGKGNFLGGGLLGLEPAQQFVTSDDGEGEAVVFGEIRAHPLHNEGMLLKQFGQNVGVEEDRRLGH